MSTSAKSMAVLRAIYEYMQAHAIAPTMREIQTAVGYTSNNTVAYHMSQLNAHGLLVSGGGARKLTITPAGYAALGVAPTVGALVPAMPATAARYVVRSYGGVPFTIELDCANTRERRRVLDALIAGGFSVREVARGDDVRRKSGAA